MGGSDADTPYPIFNYSYLPKLSIPIIPTTHGGYKFDIHIHPAAANPNPYGMWIIGGGGQVGGCGMSGRMRGEYGVGMITNPSPTYHPWQVLLLASIPVHYPNKS